MNNIERYIKHVKDYVDNNKDITDDLLVRYVFLDLSKRLSFDMNFIPFGNSKSRRDIYRSAYSIYGIDKSLENNVVICNTASRLMELVLKRFGIDIITVSEDKFLSRYPHVYNVVKTKLGVQYVVDIQEDMYRVKMNGRTPNYGVSPISERYVLSYFDQEQMDRRLGYITDDRYYTDDYLYLLKSDIDCMDNLYDKLSFVLKHIEVLDNNSINYIDRQWYHMRILEFLFDKNDFDYVNEKGKIRFIDTYRMINGKRVPVNTILLEEDGIDHIFVYKKNKRCYEEKSIDYMVDSINNGLVLHKAIIKSVDKVLKKSKNKN